LINATELLSGFSSRLTWNAIPPDVRGRASLLAADSIGIAIRARHDVSSVDPLLRAAAALGLSRGGSSVLGDLDSYSPYAAALLNGTLIHSLDFDDTHSGSALHPSATALAAALVAAEMEHATGEMALTGAIAGYEVLCRLSKALSPADHYDRGFHPSATCGAFGAAAAAANVMRLSTAQVEHAFGIVLSLAAGSMQFLENGAWTKAFQVGHAAAVGLMAAVMAREGYRGAAAAIEGRKGFLNSFAPKPNAAAAVHGLGTSWETLAVGIKPYPACRFAHSIMDAMIELRNEHAFSVENINRISCGLSRKAIDLVGEPIEAKRLASTPVEGQFSAPFLVTAALIEGGLGWDSYARLLRTRPVEECMQRVSVTHDARAEALFPNSFAGSIVVTLTDGRRLEKFVASPKGDPDNFVTEAEVRDKFVDLVGPYLGNRSASLFQTVLHMHAVPIGDMLRATRPAMEPATLDA
jgi:2-methylcitrate dehydratase PrpD